MQEMTYNQHVHRAFRENKMSINDDAFLAAWCWVRTRMEVNCPEFEEELERTYKFLYKNLNYYSLARVADQIKKDNSELKYSGVSTDDYKKKLDGQQELDGLGEVVPPREEQKKYLNKLRGIE